MSSQPPDPRHRRRRGRPGDPGLPAQPGPGGAVPVGLMPTTLGERIQHRCLGRDPDRLDPLQAAQAVGLFSGGQRGRVRRGQEGQRLVQRGERLPRASQRRGRRARNAHDTSTRQEDGQPQWAGRHWPATGASHGCGGYKCAFVAPKSVTQLRCGLHASCGGPMAGATTPHSGDHSSSAWPRFYIRPRSRHLSRTSIRMVTAATDILSRDTPPRRLRAVRVPHSSVRHACVRGALSSRRRCSGRARQSAVSRLAAALTQYVSFPDGERGHCARAAAPRRPSEAGLPAEQGIRPSSR